MSTRPSDRPPPSGRATARRPWRGRARTLLACAAAAAVLVPLGWSWSASLAPDRYRVSGMGSVDLGGGVAPAGHGHAGHGGGGQPVSALTDGGGTADVRLDLTARRETVALASGQRIEAYTLDGGTPGPTLRVVQGDLVEVRLLNADVPDGVTLHWHGMDVPNAMDGVAGVTQDAVAPGESFTYRFRAEEAGTYWYHSHQVSHEQVRRGLLGAVVVEPAAGPAEDVDVVALAHTYGGHRTVNGRTGTVQVAAAPGSTARVRLINTDDGPVQAWVTGAAFRIAAIDGTELHRPQPVEGLAVPLTAGARADLVVEVPEGGARVDVGGAAVVLGDGPGPPAGRVPAEPVDLLTYGEPDGSSSLAGEEPDRRFEYRIDRRPGFLDGVPGLWWTVNGRMWPDVPMFTVAEGDVVRMRVSNDSGEVHPMHLHGHHALVLSRDGVPATGSPWWVDSLHVRAGESYEIAFRADNPGIWMDHCHNLEHAADGLVAHLMYEGVTTPFEIGGPHGNEPE